jgi:hypothetical protein
LSQGLSWFPVWALWIVLPWLGLHLCYDLSISRYLRAQRKPGERPQGGLFGFLRYAEVMRENSRRFESGDPLARIVTYYDWAILGGFVLLLGHRALFR